jgi:hypothetical protein
MQHVMIHFAKQNMPCGWQDNDPKHILPCFRLVPKERKSGYGMTVSKSRPESHRASLGGTSPSKKRPKKLNQNDLFQMMNEEWEKCSVPHRCEVVIQANNIRTIFFSFVPILR